MGRRFTTRTARCATPRRGANPRLRGHLQPRKAAMMNNRTNRHLWAGLAWSTLTLAVVAGCGDDEEPAPAPAPLPPGQGGGPTTGTSSGMGGDDSAAASTSSGGATECCSLFDCSGEVTCDECGVTASGCNIPSGEECGFCYTEADCDIICAMN